MIDSFDQLAAPLRTAGRMFGKSVDGAACLGNTGTVIVAGFSVLEVVENGPGDLRDAALAQAENRAWIRVIAHGFDAVTSPSRSCQAIRRMGQSL
jgi:hypothetical protein